MISPHNAFGVGRREQQILGQRVDWFEHPDALLICRVRRVLLPGDHLGQNRRIEGQHRERKPRQNVHQEWHKRGFETGIQRWMEVAVYEGDKHRPNGG